jgi:NTE family protein
MDPADGLAHEIPDIDLFSGLTETERTALGARLALRTLHRGDVLMRQGDEADALFVVLSGRLSVTLEAKPTP